MLDASEHAATSGIFIYEDDEALASEIVNAFADEGSAVTHLATEEALRGALASQRISTLILDRMVGDRDSLDLLSERRTSGDLTPVLVLSSLATADERIRGLKAGGDDYLVKPFSMGELIARVEALRRRLRSGLGPSLRAGPLTMDLVSRMVKLDGREIALLPREFILLEYFMRHAGLTVTRSMLLEDVWRFRLATHTNVVDVHVGNLRRKIEAYGGPRLIASVRGLGFRLSTGEEP